MRADIARLAKDMSQAKGIVTGAVGSINKTLGTIGVGVSFGALIAGFKSLVDSAAGLDDIAERTGATVGELSKLSQVARIGGHSMEIAEGAMVKLSKAI